MAQRDFNREIANYIEERRLSEDTTKDVEQIRKQAEEKSVTETHPDLTSDKVQVIHKDESWIKKRLNPGQDEFDEFERPSYWKRLSSVFRTREDEVPQRFEEEVEEIEHEEETAGTEETETLEREKGGLIMGFISRFRPKNATPALQEEVFSLEEDLKTIAKITTNVMKKLPSKELSEYKKSQEFETFKTVLKKRNLIREKNE